MRREGGRSTEGWGQQAGGWERPPAGGRMVAAHSPHPHPALHCTTPHRTALHHHHSCRLCGPLGARAVPRARAAPRRQPGRAGRGWRGGAHRGAARAGGRRLEGGCVWVGGQGVGWGCKPWAAWRTERPAAWASVASLRAPFSYQRPPPPACPPAHPHWPTCPHHRSGRLTRLMAATPPPMRRMRRAGTVGSKSSEALPAESRYCCCT